MKNDRDKIAAKGKNLKVFQRIPLTLKKYRSDPRVIWVFLPIALCRALRLPVWVFQRIANEQCGSFNINE